MLTNYLGLLPGKTITVNVPLVFWDAGRLYFTTDGAQSAGGSDLLGPNPSAPILAQKDQSNAFQFRYTNPSQTNVATATPNSPYLQFTTIYNRNIDKGEPKPSKEPVVPTDLKVGMGVSGPGIPANDTIASLTGASPNSITLSAAAQTPVNNSNQANIAYTFTALAGQNFGPTAIATSKSLSGPEYKNSITNGMIMWYHASAATTPLGDAPFQLTEMTFRGTYYEPKNNPGFKYLIGFDSPDKGPKVIGANDFDLVNYDVSYVDSMATSRGHGSHRCSRTEPEGVLSIRLDRVIANDRSVAGGDQQLFEQQSRVERAGDVFWRHDRLPPLL